jgi:hypothetical protein
MTAASPSAALRSGVRARIAGRSGGSYVVRWSLGIAAAAVVIVLAIVWPDREAPVDAPASSPAVATIAPPPAMNPSIEPGPTPPGPVVGQALPGSPGEPNRVRPPSEESPADRRMALVEPLVVMRLEEFNPLGVDGIEIQTLTVEALSLEPLSLQ